MLTTVLRPRRSSLLGKIWRNALPNFDFFAWNWTSEWTSTSDATKFWWSGHPTRRTEHPVSELQPMNWLRTQSSIASVNIHKLETKHVTCTEIVVLAHLKFWTLDGFDFVSVSFRFRFRFRFRFDFVSISFSVSISFRFRFGFVSISFDFVTILSTLFCVPSLRLHGLLVYVLYSFVFACVFPSTGFVSLVF